MNERTTGMKKLKGNSPTFCKELHQIKVLTEKAIDKLTKSVRQFAE